MKNLNIDVVNKRATYRHRDGVIVCGNSDYQITFTFDAEWGAYTEKTARFKWNGGYRDVAFTGTTVNVPTIENATQVEVGVYVDDLSTTTPAVIPCDRSIRCGSGSNYITPEESRNLEARVFEHGEDIAEINENFMQAKSNNLFNHEEAKRGDVDDSGVFTENSQGTYYVSNLMEVEPRSVITISCELNATKVRAYLNGGTVYEYGENGNFLTKSNYSNASKKDLLPTTRYIRVKWTAILTEKETICVKYYADANLAYEAYYPGYRLKPKGFTASYSAPQGDGIYDVVITNVEKFTTEALEALNLDQGARIWVKLKNCSFDVTLPWQVYELRLDIYENTLPDWVCKVQTAVGMPSRCKLTGHHKITLAKGFSEVEGVPNSDGTAKRYENCSNIHNLESWNGTTTDFVNCKRLMNIYSHGYRMNFTNCAYMTNVQVVTDSKYENCTNVDPYTCSGYSAE